MSLTLGRGLPIGARAGLIDPKHVKSMGSARWLYDWILWRVTAEEDGLGYVLGGSPVRCEEIAADLGVGLRTVYRWVGPLRGRYIWTGHAVDYGRHGLVIEVLKSKKSSLRNPSGNPQISTFSTASTGNPARGGRVNPGTVGRNNLAKLGRFHKEERKPFRESYRNSNSGFPEDLPGHASRRKANPVHPTPSEEQSENQHRSQKQTEFLIFNFKTDQKFLLSPAWNKNSCESCGKRSARNRPRVSRRRNGGICSNDSRTNYSGVLSYAACRRRAQRLLKAQSLQGVPIDEKSSFQIAGFAQRGMQG